MHVLMFKISFFINIHTSFPIVSASRLFADFRLASVYIRTYPPPSNFLRLFLSTFLLLPLIRFFLSSAILPPTPPRSRTFARCLSRAVLPLSLFLSVYLSGLSLFRLPVNSPGDFDECNSEISSSGRKLVIPGRRTATGIYAHTLWRQPRQGRRGEMHLCRS